MNFTDDPSNFYYSKKNLLEKRYLNCVYKELSKTSSYTSIISAGLWRLFGGHISFNESVKIFLKLLESGINHFDLGNNYGRPPGSSESIFGQVLQEYKELRDELIISSKAGYEMFPGPNGSGSSLKHLRSQIENSLKRLSVDYLDIFYTHRYDPRCEIESVADTLKYLYDLGLFLYVGISSYPKEELHELISYLNERKVPIACLQYNISLISLDNFAICKECYQKWNISTVAFSPLAQGLLTNSYLKNNKSINSRINENKTTVPNISKEMEQNFTYIKEFSQENNLSLESLAIAWLLSQKFICSALYGPREDNHIFNMLEIKKIIDNGNLNINYEKLFLNSIPDINQWKVRDIKSNFNIID